HTSPSGEQLLGAPDTVVVHFYASTYLIEGMDVHYRADIHLRWAFTSKETPPAEVVFSTWAPAHELESAHRTCLALQYPDFDYLPGPSISVPQLMDEFDLVRDLKPTGWSSSMKDNLDRYKEIAVLARAELIDDVPEMPSSSINRASNVNA